MDGAIEDVDWRSHARALAARLGESGVIRDPAWRTAVEDTPRHVFVPHYFEQIPPNGWRLVDGADPRQRGAWLDTVYSDQTLDVQLGHIQLPEEAGGGTLARPTSSSTAPSMMLRMLYDLDVSDGDQVLEIGTGTGYNAALLCHRLGDNAVTSVDLDAGLVALARDRLAGLGYRPFLTTGDGRLGVADAAPFHHIIATAAAATVPACWIDQTRAGGTVLVDVRGQLGGSMVLLRRNIVGKDRLEGRFLNYPGRFMPLRDRVDNPLREGEQVTVLMDTRDVHTSETPVAPVDLADPGFALVVHFHIPGLRAFGTSRDGSRTIYDDHGRWAVLLPGGNPAGLHRIDTGISYETELPPTLDAGGLRTAIEAAHTSWAAHGRPGPDRLGLTATSEDNLLWVDSPDHLLTSTPTWAASRSDAKDVG